MGGFFLCRKTRHHLGYPLSSELATAALIALPYNVMGVNWLGRSEAGTLRRRNKHSNFVCRSIVKLQSLESKLAA